MSAQVAQWMTAEELWRRFTANDRPLVLDVRIGQVGVIPKAEHIPVLDLEDKVWDWPRDRDIVVFCQFGKGASDYAAEVLEEQGYDHVFKLVGGMTGWNLHLASLGTSDTEGK